MNSTTKRVSSRDVGDQVSGRFNARPSDQLDAQLDTQLDTQLDAQLDDQLDNHQSDQVATHLRRIQGQINGISNMYQRECDCIDVVRQIIAARNSLGRVARDMLFSEASKCHREQRSQDFEVVLKEVFRN